MVNASPSVATRESIALEAFRITGIWGKQAKRSWAPGYCHLERLY